MSELPLTVAELKRDVHLPNDSARYIDSLEIALTTLRANFIRAREEGFCEGVEAAAKWFRRGTSSWP